MFLYFLDKNGALFLDDAKTVKAIADHTLAAFTIMIAESKPDEMEMMVKVVMNFLMLNAQQRALVIIAKLIRNLKMHKLKEFSNGFTTEYNKLQLISSLIYWINSEKMGKSDEIISLFNKLMRSVPEDETVILVAIDKYIGEGFNYPRLDTMMLTMPVAWEGNVEQYAGRLHRDYESKKNVIIYDYVDVNIRVLEKMYHKRLRTYKKIGYEICSSIITEKQETNSVYDMSSYLNVYQRDLAEANSEIIISSPGLNKTSLTNFLNLVQRKQEDGVMITVVTLDAESYPAERVEAAAKLIGILRLNGINVVLKKYMHEHFAIIDKEIVWYGSVNLLSSVKEEDNIMRIKSTEISQELMEITFSENQEFLSTKTENQEISGNLLL